MALQGASQCCPQKLVPATPSAEPAEHGLTVTDCTSAPLPMRTTEDPHIIAVPPGPDGVCVRWNPDTGVASVTDAPSTCTQYSVPAAKLTLTYPTTTAAGATTSAAVPGVQLTVLRPSFRVYVDGQRLMRVGAPVWVSPTQRVTFAAEATVYAMVAMPASATAHVDLVGPCIPAGDNRPHQDVHKKKFEADVKASRPLPFSPPTYAHPSDRSVRPRPVLALSSDTSSIATDTPIVEAPQRASHAMMMPSEPNASCRSVRDETSTKRVSVRARVQQPARPPPHRVVAQASTFALSCTVSFMPPSSVPPRTHDTVEQYVLSSNTAARLRDVSKATDLNAAASTSWGWHTSDVQDSSYVFSEKLTYVRGANTKTARETHGEASGPGHNANESLPPRCIESPPLEWGSAIRIASPQWELLSDCVTSSRRSAFSGEKAGVPCNGASSASFADSNLREALRVRRAAQKRSSERQHALSSSPDRPQRGGAMAMFVPTSTTVLAQLFTASSQWSHAPSSWPASSQLQSASSPGGKKRAKANVWEESPQRGETGASTPPRRRSPSHHPTLHLGEESEGWSAAAVLQGREKLRLKARLVVVPFVVEAFGDSHRYRPLTRVPHVTDTATTTEEGGVLPCSRGTSESVSHYYRTGAGVDVSDSAESPWHYPPAADELLTPRTEHHLKDALRLVPEGTSSEKHAQFLHDALRRTYNPATDRFTYTEAPGLARLLFRRFMAMSEQLLLHLEKGRPVRRLMSPLLCAGDLYGSFKDLLVFLGSAAHFTHWSMLHTPLLVLGNYADVGWHSVEVALLLCAWASLQPEKVHLLRGPHEDPAVNGAYATHGKRCLRYKCRQRFGRRDGVALWTRLNRIFSLLPVAAVVDGAIFAAHGGVPRLRPSPMEVDSDINGEEDGIPSARQPPRGRKDVGHLYSNTSGVPTPTTPTTGSQSLSSVRRAGRASASWSAAMGAAVEEASHSSWRPPSAVRVFPTADDSKKLSACASCEALERVGGCRYSSPSVSHAAVSATAVVQKTGTTKTSDGAHASEGEEAMPLVHRSSHRIRASASVFNTTSIDSRRSQNVGAPSPEQHLTSSNENSFAYEESNVPHPPACSSFTCMSGRDDMQSALPAAAAAAAAAAVSSSAHSQRTSCSPPAWCAHERFSPRATDERGPPARGRLSEPKSFLFDGDDVGEDTASSVVPHVPLNAVKTVWRASTHHNPTFALPAFHAPLSESDTESSSHDAFTVYDREISEAHVRPPSLSFAYTETCDRLYEVRRSERENDPAASSPAALRTPCDGDDDGLSPTEEDFEELMVALTMRDYTFATLQPRVREGKTWTSHDRHFVSSALRDDDGVKQARRCHLLRELLWNGLREPEVVTEGEKNPEEADGRVRRKEYRPSWWQPRTVSWCRLCPSSDAFAPRHRCCHAFGSWGLLHFLNRFDFSLVLSGASANRPDALGALLCEEGRLLLLRSCTRRGRQPAQAAACILSDSKLQLSVWGPQELADSVGLVSLRQRPGGQAPHLQYGRLRSFLGAQVQARVGDHHRVAPRHRWALCSAVKEFQRKRAVRRRRDDAKEDTTSSQ